MSTVNENNITDVNDSTLLENTPMMVVEQGGQTLAIPITSKGGVDQVQADWAQTDDTAVDFIKNKPEFAPAMAMQAVITDDTSTEAVISNLAANTRYVFTQPLTLLTIEAIENSNFESEVQFSTAASITVSLPDGLKFIGSRSFDPNTNYIINIKNSIAVVGYYE